MGEFFSWIILGLIAGALAKWIMPGPEPGGWIVTIIIGIVGAFIGGWLGSFIGVGTVGGLSIGSIITAVVGAIVLLFIYRMVKSRG
ncbi:MULTISPECIES: GlsB/YeaQ/YmgE family stress response membrane protein [Microbulbifer]|uniref:GlsB/YeaQ/YmgE family stress response membrane protein n=1 Tax=Microbulbifer celer TaxID=435905 RepID=A0ABW3U8Y2_9GAMM|nr:MULTISPECIES: GlsB/YeaQ/YmgE family stress response membrane protein [Microbulbifer]UFN57097.1 GlsB/YeaQ/YmgE family stress response membrane protein [Microbulbifer celer]